MRLDFKRQKFLSHRVAHDSFGHRMQAGALESFFFGCCKTAKFDFIRSEKLLAVQTD